MTRTTATRPTGAMPRKVALQVLRSGGARFDEALAQLVADGDDAAVTALRRHRAKLALARFSTEQFDDD